jgi:outer membrane lipoprotein-sorting protein
MFVKQIIRMKKNFSLALAMLVIAVLPAMAQTADEIVNKHIEARGGLDKLRALQTMIVEGSMNQGGTDVNMKYYYAHNKATKVEFTAVGQTGYNIVTTTEGWIFNPFAGGSSAEPMPEAQLKDAQNSLDLPGSLIDYKAKGHTVEYLGKQSIQGVEYYKLKLTRNTGKVYTYYLDKNYLVSQVVSTNVGPNGETEVTTEFSDYRKTPEGYMIAFKRSNGNNEIIIDKVEINPKIDDSVFKPTN